MVWLQLPGNARGLICGAAYVEEQYQWPFLDNLVSISRSFVQNRIVTEKLQVVSKYWIICGRRHVQLAALALSRGLSVGRITYGYFHLCLRRIGRLDVSLRVRKYQQWAFNDQDGIGRESE